jgi:hypothetical protein
MILARVQNSFSAMERSAIAGDYIVHDKFCRLRVDGNLLLSSHGFLI